MFQLTPNDTPFETKISIYVVNPNSVHIVHQNKFMKSSPQKNYHHPALISRSDVCYARVPPSRPTLIVLEGQSSSGKSNNANEIDCPIDIGNPSEFHPA